MPIEKDKLEAVFKEMKSIFLKDPENAVRSQEFIKKLHEYCIGELKRIGVKEKNGVKIKDELTVYGAHKTKNVDVGVFHEEAGPLIGISIRSQMSSVMKNFANYYEMLVGEVTSIHEKYPSLVYGLIYLLPLKTIRKDKEGKDRKEHTDFTKIEKLWEKVSNRIDEYGVKHKYEAIALVVVDFEQNPPKIVNSIPMNPDLTIDNFFDNLIEIYKKRNMFLEITS